MKPCRTAWRCTTAIITARIAVGIGTTAGITQFGIAARLSTTRLSPLRLHGQARRHVVEAGKAARFATGRHPT